MDTTTPEKSKNDLNESSSHRGFMDSPSFSDYLRSLSPIKPAEQIPFSSLQSVFIPPHVSTSDPPSLEFSTNDWNAVIQNNTIVDAGHKENMYPPPPKNHHVPNELEEDWSDVIAELIRSPKHIPEHAGTSYPTSDRNLEGVGSGTDPIKVPTSLCNWDAVISNPSDSSVQHAMQNTLTLPLGGMYPASCSYMNNEEINPSSSNKKRRTSEQAEEGEGGSCKGCTCQKSKCLKLYCKCFAAGVYCMGGPCACKNCFNKPIHKDTVLATRRQILSRNPLAFDPKVIPGSDSLPEMGDDLGITPESTSHKRGGCNCKKSGCLKKYCECYQGRVGCSIYCRCEGCKNEFGAKDCSRVVSVDHELEEGETNVTRRSEKLNRIASAIATLPGRGRNLI